MKNKCSILEYIKKKEEIMRYLESNEKIKMRESLKTSHVIYEAYRQRDLEGKHRTRLVLILSCLLSLAVIAAIGLLQYDEYFALIHDRIDYINQSKSFCNATQLANIDIISTPIAGALILFYIVLYKRRVFLRTKFKFRNIGLPMQISCWNKRDRLFTAFTYGLIAFNVYNIVRNSLQNNKNSKRIIPFKDPSGILNLLVKIMEMFLIGIRYYPILVAYRANSFLITFSSCIYMWIDFVSNIYYYGKCESISNEDVEEDKAELRRRMPYFIAYKVMSAVPLSLFSTFILITLTYKSFVILIDLFFKNKHLNTKHQYLIENNRDNLFRGKKCALCNINDENEILYSNSDLNYVLRLFNKDSSNTAFSSSKTYTSSFLEYSDVGMKKTTGCLGMCLFKK
jgi:hypothetical protein